MTQSFIKIMSGENLADTHPNKDFTLVTLPEGMSEIKFNQKPTPHLMVNGTRWEVEGNVYVMNQSGKTIATYTPKPIKNVDVLQYLDTMSKWTYFVLDNYVIVKGDNDWYIAKEIHVTMMDKTGAVINKTSVGGATVSGNYHEREGKVGDLYNHVVNKMSALDYMGSEVIFVMDDAKPLKNIKQITIPHPSQVGMIGNELKWSDKSYILDKTEQPVDYPLKEYLDAETINITTKDNIDYWIHWDHNRLQNNRVIVMTA